ATEARKPESPTSRLFSILFARDFALSNSNLPYGFACETDRMIMRILRKRKCKSPTELMVNCRVTLLSKRRRHVDADFEAAIQTLDLPLDCEKNWI
ncbi:hypothetical protein ACFO7X_002940, partial [Enterobacter asburiae]